MVHRRSLPIFVLSARAWRDLGLAVLAGILAGSASAFFYGSLEWAASLRETFPGLGLLLPIGGFGIGWLYLRAGSPDERSLEDGHARLIEEIRSPLSVIPFRVAPLVFFTTFLTHLFGGSAGREGAAVQLGGAFADQLTAVFSLKPETRRILLMAGMSAGFASIFGTPFAGAMFALEALAFGALSLEALLPCLLAAWIAHLVFLAWGIRHPVLVVGSLPVLSFANLLWVGVAGACFGAVAALYRALTDAIGAGCRRWIRYAPLRPALGGLGLVLAFALTRETRYQGLGVPVIVECFAHAVPVRDFGWKTLATAWTLGTGFKGGEVTPLFFIGATLGNALSRALALPFGVLSGLGYTAVFGAATALPVTAALVAVELFGGQIAVYAGIACGVAYWVSRRLVRLRKR